MIGNRHRRCAVILWLLAGSAAAFAQGRGGAPLLPGNTNGAGVLTQVSTKSARRPEIDSDPPLVIPRGPSNAKLALLAAAITFVAITGAILFLGAINDVKTGNRE